MSSKLSGEVTLWESGMFLGIDMGTGGVRVLAARRSGQVAASAQRSLTPSALEEDRHEQDPERWWTAAASALSEVTAAVDVSYLLGLAVDGTSGTLVCVDATGDALRPAMMYNDNRAGAEAEAVNQVAAAFCERLGYRFRASFALAKILWVRQHEPRVFDRALRFIHQADYIVGRLTGDFGVTDYSNALKTGYDLIDECWPDWLDSLAGVRERLGRVVAPGTRVGEVSSAAARTTGLPAGLPVVAGATDGTAAFLASGARRPGDCNTTLGTTLVFKGLSRRIGKHPDGQVYSHKLPGGLWLPGAASNTGGECIERHSPDADLSALDRAAGALLPCASVAYPLCRQGERFPFLSAEARGFCVPEAKGDAARHAAHLQGVALVERMGYEVLDQVMATRDGDVFATGGGSRSDVWMQCRSDVTGRVCHRPACPESAFGSAMLAATGVDAEGLPDAVRRMVKVDRTFQPNSERRARYDAAYGRFRDELSERGYV